VEVLLGMLLLMMGQRDNTFLILRARRKSARNKLYLHRILLAPKMLFLLMDNRETKTRVNLIEGVLMDCPQITAIMVMAQPPWILFYTRILVVGMAAAVVFWILLAAALPPQAQPAVCPTPPL